jgi:putative membrane protein
MSGDREQGARAGSDESGGKRSGNDPSGNDRSGIDAGGVPSVSGEDKKELAEERTGWAAERTMLAKERTFSAWMRTGMAAVAAGLGITRLFGDVEPAWIIPVIGSILVVVGAVILAGAFVRYKSLLAELNEEGVRGFPVWAVGIVTASLIVAAALSLVLIHYDGG